MTKPWEHRHGRSTAVRQFERHLIVCEDSKSSADYLKSFKVPESVAEITVVGGAGNTQSVVRKGIELQNKATTRRAPYARVWCVIDKDDHPDRRYHEAFHLANHRSRPEFAVIWANECFELWYLLHFVYRDTAIGRAALATELGKPDRLGKPYRKGDASIFPILAPLRETAIRNSQKLLDLGAHRDHPHMHNPSTNLHELIKMLIALHAAA